ncbi:hypothetical protein G8A07_13650 [Roseateles sp. DAIF2]|uniref:hypothetical protein n=1 Tax=Roseateles sp. DAIF2 TaxID=2714952 RepID=UPI0018A2CDA7|nr:hypothetical protein [Roseateles sp. DAIF2]QPF73861.1 hypothetical protein G8A07_13650 [Roseateles sp. DAIF2]
MPRPQPALTRWLLWLALALLLSAQGLGQLHRIAHAPQQHSHSHHEDGWGHASGSADCQILDHLAHEGGPLPLAQLAPAPLPQGWTAAAAPSPVFLSARWSYGARAPPRPLQA